MHTASVVAVLLVAIVGLSTAATVPFVGGTTETALTELHAVVLLAVIDGDTPNNGYLGGGSIISQNRVLTAAHVVANSFNVRCWFYVDDVSDTSNRRVATSLYTQIITNYDDDTRKNDLAVLMFRNIFPAANVIALIVEEDAPATGSPAALAGFGFTTPDSVGPNLVPLLAEHEIVDDCLPLVASETHICAKATAPAFVCPGDNGSGLFTGAAAERRLIGVLSQLQTNCTQAAVSSFTYLGKENIQIFLMSQGLTPGEVPVLPDESDDGLEGEGDDDGTVDEGGDGGLEGEGDDDGTVDEGGDGGLEGEGGDGEQGGDEEGGAGSEEEADI